MMEDLEWAGGIPSLLKALAPVLARDCATVAGPTLGELCDAACTGDPQVIRPLDDPIATEGGIAVLRGSLAPDSAVVKQGAVAPDIGQGNRINIIPDGARNSSNSR